MTVSVYVLASWMIRFDYTKYYSEGYVWLGDIRLSIIYIFNIWNVADRGRQFRGSWVWEEDWRVTTVLCSTKKRFRWKFCVGGTSYTLELSSSTLSGKRIVTLNNQEIHSEQRYKYTNLVFSTSTLTLPTKSKDIHLESPVSLTPSTPMKWGSITKPLRKSKKERNSASRNKRTAPQMRTEKLRMIRFLTLVPLPNNQSQAPPTINLDSLTLTLSLNLPLLKKYRQPIVLP